MAKKYLHELPDNKINSFCEQVFSLLQRVEAELEKNEDEEIDVESFERELADIMDKQRFIVPDEWFKLDGIDFNDATHPMDGKVSFDNLKALYIDRSERQEELDYERVND